MGYYYCSVMSLCFAAITCLSSVAFVGIAFSTDNWVHISVDRHHLKIFSAKNPDDLLTAKDMESNPLYFDRVKGIFRICFPFSEKPIPARSKASDGQIQQQPKLTLYLNPVDEWCTNVNYFVETFKNGISPSNFTYDGTIWLHLARCGIISFAFYFMFTGISCVTGLIGCWKMSGDQLITTAILMLVATLWGGAGMGFWHGAQFYEYNRVHDERLEFYLTWPSILRDNTSFNIGWSYIVAWVGIAVSLISSIMFSMGAICIKHQFKQNERCDTIAKMQYMPPQYGQWATPYSLPSRSPPPPFSSPAGYYTVGYPQHDEVTDSRLIGKYKNVVKELEDSNL